MKEFARAILSDNEDKLTCEECKQQMDATIDAQLNPEDDVIESDEYELIKVHVEQCPSCAQVYEQLLAISDLATSMVAPPLNRPKFDLSFLDSPAQKETADSTKEVEISTKKSKEPSILHQFGHLIIEFTDELLQPRQPLTYATVGVRSGDLAIGVGSTDTDYRFHVEVQGRRLEAIIRREDVADKPDYCTIIVEIDTPDEDGWIDWEGRAVSLSCKEIKVGDRATDVFGQAIFENVEIRHLDMLKVDINLEELLYN